MEDFSYWFHVEDIPSSGPVNYSLEYCLMMSWGASALILP